MELCSYVRGEQWDKVVAGYKAAVSDMRTLSLLNLALACQGELGDKLFHYPQQGKGRIIARMEQYGSGGNSCCRIFATKWGISLPLKSLHLKDMSPL